MHERSAQAWRGSPTGPDAVLVPLASCVTVRSPLHTLPFRHCLHMNTDSSAGLTPVESARTVHIRQEVGQPSDSLQ